MKLILSEALKARIESEARASYPLECCGLIEGVRESDRAVALALHAARNRAARPDRFEIDPEDHFAALRVARNNGRALIGCYHSHPGGRPEPSADDLRGAGEDGFLWLIAALESAEGPVTMGAFAYSSSLTKFSSAALLGPLGAEWVTSSGKSRI